MIGINFDLSYVVLVDFLAIAAEGFHLIRLVAQSVEFEISIDVLDFENREAASALQFEYFHIPGIEILNHFWLAIVLITMSEKEGLMI